MKSFFSKIPLFLALLLIFSSISFAQVKSSGTVHSAEVAPFGEALFTIYGDFGAATAAKRADLIEDNIHKLSRDPLFKASEFKIINENHDYKIVYMDETIIGLTDLQAQMAGKSQRELAKEYVSIISDAVVKERKGHLKTILIEEIVISIVVIFIAVIFIRYLNVFNNYMNRLLLKKKNADSKQGKIDIEKEAKLTFDVIRIIKVILIAFILYICFLIFLWLLPETRWIADSMVSYIESPVKKVLSAIWNYIPNLITIIVIIIIARLISKILLLFANKIANGAIEIRSFQSDWAMPTYHIIRVLLIVFALIFIFPLLPNSNSMVFKGISVFLGVLISLGSTSIISNIVSGLVITYMRPFNVGDRIKMGDNFGDVIEKNSLVTRIKTTKNEIITIPNSTIMTANTTNFTNSAKNYGLILHINITVGYDVDWKIVHKLLIKAALKTKGVLKKPEPFVQQKALDNFNIKYEVNVYTKEAATMTKIYSDLHQNIQDIFSREGIELFSPVFSSIKEVDNFINKPKNKSKGK